MVTCDMIHRFFKKIKITVWQRKQAQRTLTDSEQKAKQYLDIAGVIILALDEDGNITLINERGLKVLGYQREELLGKNWFKTCLPDKFREKVADVYRQLMRGEIKPVKYYENQIQKKGGEKRIIQALSVQEKTSPRESRQRRHYGKAKKNIEAFMKMPWKAFSRAHRKVVLSVSTLPLPSY